MRLCFLCNEYPPGPHGGIGTLTQVLTRALAHAGHEVRVIGMYPANYPAPNYEEDQGVRVWRLRESVHRFGWIRSRYRLYQAVARWSRERKVDLVEVPDWEGWAAGWPRLAVPVVARLHGSSSYFAAELGTAINRSAFWLERRSLQRADFWCSASRYTAGKTRKLFGLRSNPSAILHNSVEIPAHSPGTVRSSRQVVFSGTLTAKKGIISLIQAWPRVSEACPDAELHIYGKDGRTEDKKSMREFLLSQLSGQARQSVRFHGHVTREKLFHALQMARSAVFPSYAEAFALAPLEAMAYGCPTIYSRHGSGPELIEHDRDGLLIDPDQPVEIADAIIRILTDDRLSERLERAGRKRVEESFSVQALLGQNEAFYQGCISDFRQTPARPESRIGEARERAS